MVKYIKVEGHLINVKAIKFVTGEKGPYENHMDFKSKIKTGNNSVIFLKNTTVEQIEEAILLLFQNQEIIHEI